ncbi:MULTISPECIES: polysaccharide biosynthesis tyrosine autokinase [Nocardioides]|uniref:AAA family ATPase n=1 Tax=Nocardioides vastitatis TaxID=2568655 RepID=A0ABW0ZDQ4_9ACTN|nr:polysaccharide biosynthesis tyrosine autokinase [Nocardioides sp.]THI98873.1 hypothetical protein E7Z54_13140 [Nocardioides sp.]
MSAIFDPPIESVRPAPSSAQTGLRALGALLWRRRLVVSFVFVLMAATVTTGLLLAEREYTATARVAATPPAELSTSPASYSDLLGTVADVAESRPLLDEVRQAVPGRSVEQLRDQVQGDVVAGTVIIQVSVTDTDPDRAATIANLVVERLPEHDPSNGAFVFHVTEPADVPERFSSPDIPLTLLAATGLALLLAVAVAAVVDRVFRTVSDAQELAEVSDLAVLGVVPRPSAPEELQATDPHAEEFQSLRALRIAIEFASAEDPARLLVVASASGADPWAGWLEVNLAAALAEVGHRVLLVDADRDRGMHPALGAPGDLGLYDVLSGTSTVEEAAQPGPVDGVHVLPLGTAHLAAPSLLEMRFRDLLDDTEDRYDVVIVHAAPISGSEDARIMAIHGAMLLTVPAGRIHPRHVQRAVEHLQMIRLRVLGSVLHGVRPPRSSRRPRLVG